eukprot:759307-Hanusia_phi.AAC.1
MNYVVQINSDRARVGQSEACYKFNPSLYLYNGDARPSTYAVPATSTSDAQISIFKQFSSGQGAGSDRLRFYSSCSDTNERRPASRLWMERLQIKLMDQIAKSVNGAAWQRCAKWYMTHPSTGGYCEGRPKVLELKELCRLKRANLAILRELWISERSDLQRFRRVE